MYPSVRLIHDVFALKIKSWNKKTLLNRKKFKLFFELLYRNVFAWHENRFIFFLFLYRIWIVHKQLNISMISHYSIVLVRWQNKLYSIAQHNTEVIESNLFSINNAILCIKLSAETDFYWLVIHIITLDFFSFLFLNVFLLLSG